MEKIYLDFSQINVFMTDIIHKITWSKIKFDRIVGIANGGLYVSKSLSEYFEVPHEEIKISFYGKGYQDYEPEEEWGDFDPHSSSFILVDDLIDSGYTLNHFIHKTNLTQGIDFYVATLHWNPYGEYNRKPDFYSRMKEDQWLVYPWENDKIVSE